jgi:protein SCO1/2
VLVVVGLFAAGCGSSAEPQLFGIRQDPTPQVGELALPDGAAGGELAPFRAAPGELLLVYFGFTNCPDMCPLTMSDIAAALADRPELADRVEVAMVTVDPARDTPELLASYVTSFVDRARALRTDDPALLRSVATTFGASYLVEPGPDGRTEVSHSGYLYGVDDQGRVVVTWPFGVSPEDLGSDLSSLLSTDNRPQEDT